MNDALGGQTLALAAAFQGLANVVSIATRGRYQRDEVEPCIQSLLGVFEGDIAALYGGVPALETGLRRLIEQLERPTEPMLARYLAAVLYLERRLRKTPKVLGSLGDGLARARRQVDYFGDPLHPNVIGNLAGLYGDTISTMRPRIMVHGSREYLEQPANAHLIRALLLAGIRAGSLWHAAGGRRWRLLFSRHGTAARARALLDPLGRH